MHKFIMTVGVPGTGKSTWIKEYFVNRLGSHSTYGIISSDDILDTIGEKHGMSYNELFDDNTYSFCEKMMYKIAKHHFSLNKELIIWDQTNLTPSTRMKKLQYVPKHYKKVAVYFPIPEDHFGRLANRPGKVIPEKVLSSMIKNLKVPTVDEGFDRIIIK
jgi:predicted kinase